MPAIGPVRLGSLFLTLPTRALTGQQIMVETTDQAESVILGENGIIQSAKQGDIVLCMSTIDPLAARRFAERLGAKGVAMLDAPVSGGTHGAAAATLSVIVGGLAETFAASEDLFRAMGKNVFHVGELGH